MPLPAVMGLDRVGPFIRAVANVATGRDVDVRLRGRPFRNAAGVKITDEVAVTIATVWACIRYISQTIGMLPWRVHVPLRGRKGSEVADWLAIDWLIYKRPNPEWSSMQFRETLTHWAIRRGNGWAEIERSTQGVPLALWPIHPDRVTLMRDLETRELFCRVSNGYGEAASEIPYRDMFHIRGFGDGPIGVSVIDVAAESLAWAKAAQTYAAAFFGNGANISGVVQSKTAMEEPTIKRIRREFNKLYRGVDKSNQVAFLDAEMEFKATGVEPLKAQMIEANQHLVEEICRWFGVPPHKVSHLLRATFSNIEQQSIEVVQDALMPWTKRWEDEADYKLFGQNRYGFFTKINLRGLLRGDFQAQQQGLQIMRNGGAINVDEWREFLDMNPLPAGKGGEKYVMQGQYTMLEKIGEEPAAPAPGLPAPGEDDPEEPDEPATEEEMEAFRALLVQVGGESHVDA